MFVHVGNQVHAGQLLVTLDDTNARARLAAATGHYAPPKPAIRGWRAAAHIRAARALQQYRQSKIDRDQAARDLDAVQKLAAKGAAAPSEVAQAQTAIRCRQASLHSLEEQKTKPFARSNLTRDDRV